MFSRERKDDKPLLSPEWSQPARMTRVIEAQNGTYFHPHIRPTACNRAAGERLLMASGTLLRLIALPGGGYQVTVLRESGEFLGFTHRIHVQPPFVSPFLPYF